MNTKDAAKIAMRGAGYYSSNTVGAKAVIDKVGDLVVEAIAHMPAIADARPFSIADFGAADAMAINRLTGTGSVSLDGHFGVVDSTTTDDAGNMLNPRNPAVGKTVMLPNVIRTGIGSIDIASPLQARHERLGNPLCNCRMQVLDTRVA